MRPPAKTAPSVRLDYFTRPQRLLRAARARLPALAAAAADLRAKPDTALRERMDAHRRALADGADLDAHRVGVMALVQEAARRTLGLQAHPEQLLAAQLLADGHVVEMATGEGKTLAAAFAAVLWALRGQGVHVLTANDYLAGRDAATLAPLYGLLGVSVAALVHGQDRATRAAAYACDITYGTTAQFGFDLLRHHLARDLADQVRRAAPFALVDEVDSLLIDEARTPLVLSGPAQDPPLPLEPFRRWAAACTPQAHEDAPGDYFADEKQRQVHLSDAGAAGLEAFLRIEGWLPAGEDLTDPRHLELLHQADLALRAHALLHRDIHYLVQDGQVCLVDPHTGRVQAGRRWNHGLHQAVEAKEGLPVHPESRRLGTIAIQHYIRSYPHLAGMTGTARTQAREFDEVYGLVVVPVPTHRPMIRIDHPDVLCVSAADKLRRIAREARACQARGQPVLVGTPSVAVSDQVARALADEGVVFASLNARDHAAEAQVIAQAGRPGAVTLATAMAGRGTDIVLGGDPAQAHSPQEWQARHDQVVAAGGLHVIGVERQQSRRADAQLRGRAGRQGDPGSSRFYLSLDDELLRVFASPRVRRMLAALGLVEGRIIEDRGIARRIKAAQQQVESHHANARKVVLDYDAVVHAQRKHLMAQRQQWLEGPVPWDEVRAQIRSWMDESNTPATAMAAWATARDCDLAAVEARVRQGMLQAIDRHWQAHLERLEILRQGIHLRGYAQRPPLAEYQADAHAAFQATLADIRGDAVQAWLSPAPSPAPTQAPPP